MGQRIDQFVHALEQSGRAHNTRSDLADWLRLLMLHRRLVFVFILVEDLLELSPHFTYVVFSMEIFILFSGLLLEFILIL